jgi:hypothetical protein
MPSIAAEPERAKRLAIAGETFIKIHPSPTAMGKLMRDRLATLGLC